MATLSSELISEGTSGVNGSSQISVEEIETSLDLEDFLDGAVFVGEGVGVKAHCYKIFFN